MKTWTRKMFTMIAATGLVLSLGSAIASPASAAPEKDLSGCIYDDSLTETWTHLGETWKMTAGVTIHNYPCSRYVANDGEWAGGHNGELNFRYSSEKATYFNNLLARHRASTDVNGCTWVRHNADFSSLAATVYGGSDGWGFVNAPIGQRCVKVTYAAGAVGRDYMDRDYKATNTWLYIPSRDGDWNTFYAGLEAQVAPKPVAVAPAVVEEPAAIVQDEGSTIVVDTPAPIAVEETAPVLVPAKTDAPVITDSEPAVDAGTSPSTEDTDEEAPLTASKTTSGPVVQDTATKPVDKRVSAPAVPSTVEADDDIAPTFDIAVDDKARIVMQETEDTVHYGDPTVAPFGNDDSSSNAGITAPRIGIFGEVSPLIDPALLALTEDSVSYGDPVYPWGNHDSMCFRAGITA